MALVHPELAKKPAPVGARRFVTVLFADVSGSSEHAESMDPEAYAAILCDFRQIAREVIGQYGGVVARLQGDGVLALFGHLHTREDDGRRATQAALDLQAAAAELTVRVGSETGPMRLHSGVHAGLVLLIDGDIELGRYDVVGEVVNTTARLSSLAGSGEVLVSVECLGPQVSFFKTRALGHLRIRGRRQPLDALCVLERTDAGRRIDAAARRGAVAFIGRDALLDQLHQALLESRQGTVTLVLRGEPGIGKTRAAEEFAERAAGTGGVVLRGFCEHGLGAEPLQPFAQILRGLLGWRHGTARATNEAAVDESLAALQEPHDSALRRYAGDLLQLVKPPDGGAGQLSAAFASVLQRLSWAGSVLVVLDDWQWADDASRKLLQVVVEAGLPVLLLMTTRPLREEDPTLAGARVVDLQPLPESFATSAIQAWLPSANAFVTQEIFRLSGGSPLFIEELCHAEAAGRGLREAPRMPGLAWVNSLVASRVEGLPPQIAEVLRVAAVLGMSVQTWMLERLMDPQQAAAGCLFLQDMDFLLRSGSGDEWRFKHLITRDAVYATVPLDQRRALHRAAAQMLLQAEQDVGTPEHLEGLAYHFDAAGEAEEALKWADAAGDRAYASMALDRARSLYLTALGALHALPELSAAQMVHWCRIGQKLGQTCVFDALDLSEAMPFLNRAAELAAALGDANAMARAHYWLGYVNYGKGQPRRSVHHCRVALDQALASGDERLAAQVRATLGQALASAGHYGEALPVLRLAMEQKRKVSRPGSGAAIGSAYTLARLAYTLGDLGRFEEAYACFDESIALLGSAQHVVRASVIELRCVVLTWQGRWTEARAAGLLGAEIALRCRSRFNTEMGRALAACAGWAATGSESELKVLRDATAWIEARGGAVSTSLNYGWLVQAAVERGNEAEARQHAARLLLRARAQDRHGEAQGWRALARLAWVSQEWARAEYCLRAAERSAAVRASPREEAHNRLARAQLALAAGQAASGLAHGRAAREDFEAMQMTTFTQQVDELLAAAVQG